MACYARMTSIRCSCDTQGSAASRSTTGQRLFLREMSTAYLPHSIPMLFKPVVHSHLSTYLTHQLNCGSNLHLMNHLVQDVLPLIVHSVYKQTRTTPEQVLSISGKVGSVSTGSTFQPGKGKPGIWLKQVRISLAESPVLATHLPVITYRDLFVGAGS